MAAKIADSASATGSVGPLSGRNCGTKVRKNSATFGFRAFDTKPCANGRPPRASRSGSLGRPAESSIDRKSTRLNSSHQIISYAVFCLKKKKNKMIQPKRQATRHRHRTLQVSLHPH